MSGAAVSTADLVVLLQGLDEDTRRELDAILLVGDAPIWVPQPGPQTEAYESLADIVFYGGAAGGGKTDLLLGLCLTSQKHSIVFRRQAVQLTGIEERMTNILGTRDGYNSQDGIWRLPGGRVMELGSVKEPGDWIKYQGRPHDMKCVGRGTPVLMADGTYKAIEDVRVGDVVQTIEGPRKVTRTMTQRKQAVVLRVTDADGELLASQVQSASHQVLGPCGWVSLDTLTCPDASLPTQRHCACKCEGSSSQTYSPAASTPSSQYPCSALQQERSEDHEGCQSLSDSCAGEARTDRGIYCAASACPRAEGGQHSLVTGPQAHQSPSRALSGQDCVPPSCGHGAPGALAGSSPQDCLDGCLSCSHLCDGQPRHAEVAAPGWSLQQDGAGQQTPSCFAGDGLGKTPTRSRRIWSYVHPYTKEIRQIEAAFCEVSWAFSRVGERELFDLTVEGANSYVTAGGIVNRNCFDEITHFTESQFRALIGWLRTDDPTIRQRVVCAGNPPTDPEGEWVKRFWAPWLDPNHPNPAKPGELRWFVTNEKGEDEEVAGPELVKVGTDMVKPKSRTFIPSSVDDNLFLLSTGYKATLQSLPEPLRSQMLRGDFNAGTADPAWQVIPTEWVKAAQARWKPRDEKGPMTAVGFDPARGGIDKSCLARRHGNWFDQMISAPGAVTKDGPTAAAFVVPQVRDGACICVDSIGIGSSALDFLVGLGLNVYAVNGAETSNAVTKAGNLRMRNRRAEAYWLLREALDPTNPEPIALPPDQELLGDLTAVRYKVVTMGKLAAIQMRSKDEVREALGRSPDKGDAVAMTFVQGIPAPLSRRNDYEEPPPPDWRL